jgi:hypothetical protein
VKHPQCFRACHIIILMKTWVWSTFHLLTPFSTPLCTK